jgi:hypothetical protein
MYHAHRQATLENTGAIISTQLHNTFYSKQRIFSAILKFYENEKAINDRTTTQL